MTDGARAATAAIDRLFRAHATPLLRLATALTGDRGVAEDLVQDAFVALARQPKPPRAGSELAYLRRTIVNLSHGRYRRLAVAGRQTEEQPLTSPAAEVGAGRRHVQDRVAGALGSLPARQRECMVLRCYAEASDTEIAAALGISTGSVKTHLHRARASLAPVLEDLR